MSRFGDVIVAKLDELIKQIDEKKLKKSDSRIKLEDT